MRSPILALENAIARSAFRIAPERADVLAQEIDLDKFALAFTNDRNFSIRVNTETHEANLPIAALEFLWCCAYTFFVLHQEYVEAQQSGAKTLDLTNIPKTSRAIDVLNWSIGNMTGTGVESWPINMPMPDANPLYASCAHVANELFLCAIAWIIHHEISHILLMHGPAHAMFTIQQEKEADLRATDWILSTSKVPLESQKRTLGIATAILAMQLLDRPGGTEAYIQTHPPSVERLNYCLDRAGVLEGDPACGFAAVALQYHLVQCGVHASLDGTSIRDVLSGFMVAFATHGRS